MRSPRAPAWARSAVFASALLSGIAALTPSAVAEEKFGRLFVFGDSYADLTLSDVPGSPPGVALNLWRVYPVPLQKGLGIPEIFDFAVGGATTVSLKAQVDAFDPTKNSFGPRDLVTLNIGGNDGIGFTLGGGTVATAPDAAAFAAGNAATEIKRLIEAGGRTFVLGEFTSVGGLLTIPRDDPVAKAFGEAYFNGMQTRLLPFAQSGVRFFMLDLNRLGNAVFDNPAKYGFTATFVEDPITKMKISTGSLCPVVPGVPSSTLICGGSIKSQDQNPDKYFLGPDTLHLTNAGFALAAEYMANQVLAPDTIAVQSGIVMSTTSAFTDSVLGRLDAMRGQRDTSGYLASVNAGGPMGLGYGDGSRARQTGPSSRLTAYSMGTFQGGSRSDSFEQVGFDYEAPSGTVGLEYSVNRNLLVGLAGNYTVTNADLNNGAAIDVHALQAAAYISYATRQLFAEALVGYGHHDLDLARPGVIDTVRSSTDANTFAAAARGAYLFDFGGLRAGPIAGLTYIHARVDGYTERGDELLTYNVSAQTLDTLTGNVGVQFRTQFLAGGNLVSPFVNVTLEHQFGDNTRTLTLDQVQTNLFVPIFTPVANFDTRTYGRVEGGVTFQIGPSVSATVNAASTFARDEGNDYRISTGLNYRF